MHLQAYNNLTPTHFNVNNKFSVQYFLNLVLIDFEERRYFKQMEINLIRTNKKRPEKEEKSEKTNEKIHKREEEN